MAVSHSQTPALPISGIRVLDLTRALAGPFCTMILGDFGADVVKVEPDGGGDMIRTWGPFDRGQSAYYLSGNRNKRGISVNFRSPEGLKLLREMAVKADVVVENFRTGAMEAMGLGFESLSEENPALIYASISGFGRSGPGADWPGFDQIAQGYSGLMSLTGTSESGPTRVGVAIGDQTAGMWAALGILAALNERQRTGRGQRVETSLLAGLVGLLSVQGQRHLSLGEVPGLAGNTHPVISPYGVFATGDGPLNIASATQGMWRKLCMVTGLESLVDDPRFVDNAQRVERRDELKRLIEEKLRTQSRQYWTEIFIREGIPAGPINDLADVFSDAQVAHCGLVEEVDHPELGSLRMVGSAVSMESFGGQSVRRAPPLLGQHTVEILRDFGYGESAIQTLLDECVVVQYPHNSSLPVSA